MGAILALLVGLIAIGGYFYRNMSNYDASVFAYSKERVQAMLVDAKTTLPRRDGGGQIQIWSPGRSARGVTLNMKYASWAPLLTCEAVITAITPNQSRVVPACGSGTVSDSALSRTQEELQTPMFEEHILATLNKRAFDRTSVDWKEGATVFRNLGGMQSEALRRASEAR